MYKNPSKSLIFGRKIQIHNFVIILWKFIFLTELEIFFQCGENGLVEKIR